jgi:hypothetical protein
MQPTFCSSKNGDLSSFQFSVPEVMGVDVPIFQGLGAVEAELAAGKSTAESV